MHCYFLNPKQFFSSSCFFFFLRCFHFSFSESCKIEGIRGGFVSLSLVERKTVKKRRGFIVRSSIGLLRFLLPRKRRLKEKH